MADTCCAGSNWIMLASTGMTCDVYPFKEGYEPATGIPVGTCATLVETEDDSDYIIIGHQMLYFGKEMETSLLNQNQIRHYISHYGGTVQDDYTRDEPFGITTDKLFIPFDIEGASVHFVSRTPTRGEIESLPHVVITSEEPWEKILQTRLPRRRQMAGTLVAPKPAIPPHETDANLGAISTVFDEQAGLRTILATNTKFERRDIATVTAVERHSKHSPETLAKMWKIGLQTAKDTMRVTTQHGIRHALHPISRRYRVDHIHLHRNRLHGNFFFDTMESKITSLRGNTVAHVLTNGAFCKVMPSPSKKYAGESLRVFSRDVGIPDKLHCDQAAEHTGPNTEFMNQVRHLDIDVHFSEKGRKNQNAMAERDIGILKQRWQRRMVEMAVPRRLWDYGLQYEAEIMSMMVRGNNERTGYEQITGKTPDISEWLDFAFYERVWYHYSDNHETSSDPRRIGRWLGVSHRIGSDMCYWVLTYSGKVISSTTVQHVTKSDMNDPELRPQIDKFDADIKKRLVDHDENFIRDDLSDAIAYLQDEYSRPDHSNAPPDQEYGDMIEEPLPDDDDTAAYDEFLNALVKLPLAGETLNGRVVKRSKGPDGRPIGTKHKNPAFDTRKYIVELADGSLEEIQANIIAENIFAQVDSEGRSYELMHDISGHRVDTAIALKHGEGEFQSHNGNIHRAKTTKGWELLVTWKNGGEEWVPLKLAKESNPIQVAEYAIAHGIENEPAFAWWVPSTIRDRNRIVAKVKKYWRTTHKFGIELPKNAEEAYAIDRRTGTTFWTDAIEKEMRRVRVAWKEKEGMTPEMARRSGAMPGYTEIKCHMVFDVKMDFTRKARFVAGGHMTEAPSTITYSSVVTRDSVRIAFLAAALNDLDILACDISNAYLNAPCRERVWFEGGIETGVDRGKVLIIGRALYGLKSSGASWRATLASKLQEMGFEDTRIDPDVWRRKATKPKGGEYYELLLVYVDDILMVSHDPKPTLEEIGSDFEIKKGSLKAPDIYLGAQIDKRGLPDGTSAWAMSSDKYVRNAVKTVEAMLEAEGEGYRLKTTARNPYPLSYKPELDVSPELNGELHARYRQLIGILRWAIELGRLDIYVEVSLLSQYLASPREGHLEAVYHIFAYLSKHSKTQIAFDARDVSVDENKFAPVSKEDWKEFYGDVVEEVAPFIPEPLGNAVDIHCFVDADHAGNLLTRRSHTGIIIFVQNAPVLWYSKKQNTVESSSFGSEFVAMRTARDMIVGLRHKLRAFGIPLRGPANVFCDNQGVVKNTSLPQSTLSKRHNAINYHVVRESVAAGIMRVGKEDGNTNLADAFTKVLPLRKRYALFYHMMYSSMFKAEEREPRMDNLAETHQ